MFFYEGQSCPVCGKHFAESDDIVTCPQCGCPHHRECWKQEGKCHFDADHGTDHQWAQGPSAPKATVPQRNCPHCGAQNPEFAEICAQCGKDLGVEDWHTAPSNNVPPPPVEQYTPPFHTTPPFQQPFGAYQPPFVDPYGGIPRTEEIDGVPVDQIAELVGSNTLYYLPRFHKMAHGGSKISWNWAAFLFSANWLLYRKNILWGALVFVLETVLQYFSQFASGELAFIDQNTGMITFQAYQHMMNDPHSRLLLLIFGIASLASILLSVFLGMFGNYIYMRSILAKAKQQQLDPSLRYNRSFFNTGGTSFALALAPSLVIVFIEYVQILFAGII